MTLVGAVITDSLRLLSGRAMLLLLRRALPSLLLGALSLYATLAFYLARLKLFMVSPNTQSSSLALGAVALCLVCWCLSQSVASMAITREVTGKRSAGRAPIRRAELRLFGAVLRYLVLAAVWAVLVAALVMVLGRGRAPYPVASMVFALGGIFLAARTLFLAPAVVAFERGSVLRRAWRLSAVQGANVLLLWGLVYLLPVLLLETAGESLLGALHILVPLNALSHAIPSVGEIDAMQRLLPGVVVSLSIANGLGLILASVAAVHLYGRLAGVQPLPHEDLPLPSEIHAG